MLKKIAPLIASSLLASSTLAADSCDLTRAFIQKGVIAKVDAPGKTLAHIWVKPMFFVLEYEHKVTVVGLAHSCHYGGLYRGELSIIRDNQSGKRIGKFMPPDRLTLD